jgi:lipoprotein-anchoring transpeptidase ErfK/SrfK
MIKNKRLFLGLVFISLISTSGFLYNKKVQATHLESQFQTALKSYNYENVKKIQEKITSDIVVSKLMNFNEKSNSLAKEQYEIIKTSYLDDTLTYSEFNSKLDYLQSYLQFSPSENEKAELEKTESFREAYRMAYKLALEKSYKDAYSDLKEISLEIDPTYRKKLDNLSSTIYKYAVQEIDSTIENNIKKSAYSNAIDLLENYKDLLSKDYYNDKLPKLQELLAKQEEDFNSKKKDAEAQSKADPKLAAILKDYVPNAEKESPISTLYSNTNFLVWVDISSQTTNVFVGSKGKWKSVRSFISSTGLPGDETPEGTYTIKDKGTWFFSDKYQEGGQYWVRFIGNYLFHSLPMDQNKNVVDPTLGVAASHGCVRLSIENSKWIYDNVPTGTTVYIK